MSARTALVITVLMSAGWHLHATAIEVHDRILTIPAGTPLNLALQSEVSSRTSTVEDLVHARLRRSVVVSGVVVALAGTAVDGQVIEARRAGRLRGRARLSVRFTSLRAIDGRHRIDTATISQDARGSETWETGLISIGAGALIGVLLDDGGGAAIGSAVGAASAGGLALATRGEDVALDAGSTVITRLIAPVTVRVRLP
jgi:hypothetical protein